MIVYIAGKITGNSHYRQDFGNAEKQIKEKYGDDVQVLNPSVLPEGMSPADYMRICFAMIDTANIVVFLPNAIHSNGAMIELEYAKYTQRKYVKEIHDFIEHSICIPTN